ncbi:MAG: hypothetical protein IPM57_10670 [Oligoflexia bacterium]|nr:hypothetical protein [Oligoflexia bacterium]
MKTLKYSIAALTFTVLACGPKEQPQPIYKNTAATTAPTETTDSLSATTELHSLELEKALNDPSVQAKFDSLKVADMKSKQLHMVVKDESQFQTELGSSLPTHYLLMEHPAFNCDVTILSNNRPVNGQTYVFSRPKIVNIMAKDSIMVKANALDSKRIIKHLVTFECKTTSDKPITDLTVQDIRLLFKDVLDIKIAPAKSRTKVDNKL